MTEELKKQIEQEAGQYAQRRYESIGDKKGLHLKTLLRYAHQDGATTYATRAISAEQENERLRKALEIVQKWQLPPTEKFWDKEETQPMSYGACYGSNGERDFMRTIADNALSQTPKQTTNGTE